MTFNERLRTEIFQARARRVKRLTTSTWTSISVHNKTVSNPKTFPIVWTIWWIICLTVHCNNLGTSFTNSTSGNVLINLLSHNWSS
uniref:Uncharacterized protein n=1 Tax=Tetranychus urticae TaxID=32264 RepID=T1JQR8_TETUR